MLGIGLGLGIGRRRSGTSIRLDNSSVSESAGVGDLVGVFSVVNGLGSYSFTLTDDAGGLFALDSLDDTLLEVAGAIDYETTTTYSITVEADNGVDDPITRQITISVLNYPPFAVASASEVESLRQTLINIIWSGNGVPSAGITSATLDVTDPLASWSLSPDNLDRVDTWSIEMDDNEGTPVDTVSFSVWRPVIKNRRAMLMHRGHGTSLSFYGETGYGEIIRDAVNAGFIVVGCMMPFGDVDAGVHADNHNALPEATGTLNYLKFFVEGPWRSINELFENEDVAAVYMTGKSGGGWTAHMSAALDKRILASGPVASSLPLYMDTKVAPSNGDRDWEQFLPSIDHLVDYQDLYVMACDGGRTQLHCLGTSDPSVFSQPWYEAYEPFANDAAAVAATIGGTYSLEFFTTSLHEITTEERDDILALFGTGIVSYPNNLTLPSISGGYGVGVTLTCDPGTWTDSPTGYVFQWKRNGSDISNATSSTYITVAADDAETLTCEIIASNAIGNSLPASTPDYINVSVAARDVAVIPAQLNSLFVERTGASATTLASVDGPVGTIRNVGAIGGYYTAPSDMARAILRESGGVYWLEFDNADDVYLGDATLRDFARNKSRAILSFGVRFATTPTAQRNLIGFSRNGGAQARCAIYGGLTSDRAGLSGRRTDADSAAVVNGTSAIGVTDHIVTGEFEWENAAARIYVDGLEEAEDTSWQTVGTTADTASNEAVISGNGAAFLNGRFYGAVADADYSSDNRASIEAYIESLMP